MAESVEHVADGCRPMLYGVYPCLRQDARQVLFRQHVVVLGSLLVSYGTFLFRLLQRMEEAYLPLNIFYYCCPIKVFDRS